MRGDLDDALERLRRRDEVRQRLAAGSGGPTPPPPPPEEPPAPVPGPAVDEVMVAVGDVVSRHAGLAVLVTVRDADVYWTAQVTRAEDGQLTVTPAEPRNAAGAMPPPEASTDTAARLADLVRQDPSLLDPPNEPLR